MKLVIPRISATSIAIVGLAISGVAFGLASPAAADASPAPSPSAASTTWSLQPSTADAPDGRVSLRHVVEGGAQIEDFVTLTNFSDRAATFAVYAGDGTIAADGNFDVNPADEPPVAAGTWVVIGDVEGSTAHDGGGIEIEVPAESSVVVPVRVEVPSNATPGDHPAGIVAQLIRAEGGEVELASRVGVRVHLRVAGDIVAALTVESVTATYTPSWNPFAKGTMTVEFTVANAGNVRLGAQSVASAAGPWELVPGQASVTQREILPGQVATATVEVPVAPLVYSWGAIRSTPAVVGDDEVATALAEATASYKMWTMPWSQLALIALLVGVFFLVRALQRRSAAQTQAKIDAAVAAATRERADADVS